MPGGAPRVELVSLDFLSANSSAALHLRTAAMPYTNRYFKFGLFSKRKGMIPTFTQSIRVEFI